MLPTELVAAHPLSAKQLPQPTLCIGRVSAQLTRETVDEDLLVGLTKHAMPIPLGNPIPTLTLPLKGSKYYRPR
jgi:hypothetical protein